MSKRNVVLSVAAVGLLVVGLLVLIPSPAAAIKPQAPSVQITDRDTSTADTLQTTLTTVIIIPKGEYLPVNTVTVTGFKGTPTAFTDGVVTSATGSALTCTGATITSISGATASLVKLGGYGYGNPSANGYGYGYDFAGSPTFYDFDGYSFGYDTGYGYGYGSSSADVILTVKVTVNGCPAVGDFTGATGVFTFQTAIGAFDGTNGKEFVSLPSTVTLRNPEAAAPTGTAGSAGITSSVQDGAQTTLRYTLGGDGDATDEFVPAGTYALPLPTGTDAFAASISLTVAAGAVPEGASVEVSFFGPGSSAFGINPATLATLAGPSGAAGFFAITMTGLASGTASSAIDVSIDVQVATTYFTNNGLSTSFFRLLRFDDNGVRAASDPSCSLVATAGGFHTFRCTLTDFSSFAMVASAFGGGGGGSSSPVVTTTGAPISTGTGNPSSTDAPSSGSNPSGTASASGSGTKAPGKKDGNGIPGIELGLLVAALAGLALVARRQLK